MQTSGEKKISLDPCQHIRLSFDKFFDKFSQQQIDISDYNNAGRCNIPSKIPAPRHL